MFFWLIMQQEPAHDNLANLMHMFDGLPMITRSPEGRALEAALRTMIYNGRAKAVAILPDTLVKPTTAVFFFIIWLLLGAMGAAGFTFIEAALRTMPANAMAAILAD